MQAEERILLALGKTDMKEKIITVGLETAKQLQCRGERVA